jgi:hypothetical protein
LGKEGKKKKCSLKELKMSLVAGFLFLYEIETVCPEK